MHHLKIISFISILQVTFVSFTSLLKMFPVPNIFSRYRQVNGDDRKRQF